MIKPSAINPDVELRDYLTGRIVVGNGASAPALPVFGDWERPTNETPSDFLVLIMNGDIGGVGMDTPYAEGFLMASLYCKLNDDGSVKKNRIQKILTQFDELVENLNTGNYFFKYSTPQFITPTTPNISTGYSITTLNLKWNTTSNFNK